MKTYEKKIDSPRLVIEYDELIESPRHQEDTLGYFFTKESGYYSPDGNDHELYDIVIKAGDEVNNEENNGTDFINGIDFINKHIAAIKRLTLASDFSEDIIAVFPVYKYEHGNRVYRRGTAKGFDYSNCGFYIVTNESAENIGVDPEDFERTIDAELERYTKYANGEVYQFTLYDEAGEQIESGCGYYDIDDIKEALGDEWKDEDMSDYLKS